MDVDLRIYNDKEGEKVLRIECKAMEGELSNEFAGLEVEKERRACQKLQVRG
jgi:hypothetical protein